MRGGGRRVPTHVVCDGSACGIYYAYPMWLVYVYLSFGGDVVLWLYAPLVFFLDAPRRRGYVVCSCFNGFV